jgi:hypothetical protein
MSSPTHMAYLRRLSTATDPTWAIPDKAVHHQASPVDSCRNLREGRFIASRRTSAWSYWLKALFTRRLTGAVALVRAMRSSCVVRAWISR